MEKYEPEQGMMLARTEKKSAPMNVKASKYYVVLESQEQYFRSKNPDEGTGITDLPAGLTWKSRNLHAMRSTSGTGSSTLCSSKRVPIASATSKLNRQTLAHEVRTVEGYRDHKLEMRHSSGGTTHQEPHHAHP
jgi:hypothetical protein